MSKGSPNPEDSSPLRLANGARGASAGLLLAGAAVRRPPTFTEQFTFESNICNYDNTMQSNVDDSSTQSPCRARSNRK
jgi:hypothetical protein